MLETSKDVLNIVLSISVFGFTFFVCWSLYYLAMILKNLFGVVKSLRESVEKIDEAVGALKNKIESTTSYLPLIGEGLKKLVDLMKNKYGDKDSDEKK